MFDSGSSETYDKITRHESNLGKGDTLYTLTISYLLVAVYILQVLTPDWHVFECF